MKVNLLKVILWTQAFLFLVGCSMRPLSAGAFMEAYQSVNDSSKTVFGISVTGMRAFASNSNESKKDTVGNHVYGLKEEALLDVTVPFYYFMDHFEFGGGFQYLTPYITLGYASDHFGIMGWGSLGAGGISVIEQISLANKLHVGLFQFASHSWNPGVCKENYGDCGEAFGLVIDYFEFGGGTYLMYKTAFKVHWGGEFRYSYDVDHKANRFAFTLNLLWL